MSVSTALQWAMIRQLLIALALMSTAEAGDDDLSTAAALAKVTADTGCKHTDYPSLQMAMYVCEDSFTYWYFTVPSADIPPGYIRRALVQHDGGVYMNTHGHYDGTDAQQAAFDAWTRRLVASLGH